MSLDQICARWIVAHPSILWVPRLLMVWMFVESAIDKYSRFAFFAEEAGARRIPFPRTAIAAAFVVELLGAVSMLTGMASVVALSLLSGYVLVLTFIYFDFWDFRGETAIADRKEFFKNIAVAGGLFALTLATLILGSRG